jgi:flagellar biosynthetic protein FliP
MSVSGAVTRGRRFLFASRPGLAAPLRAFLLASLPLLLLLGLCVVLPHTAYAQSLTLDFGQGSEEGGGFTGRVVQLLVLVTVLSVAPSLLIMVTSFTRIVVVLSLLRSALGIQQTPPNQVLLSLALFLTIFIMAPTFQQAWTDGVVPLIEDEIDEGEAFTRIAAPFKAFMLHQTRDRDLALFADMAQLSPDVEAADVPLHVLTPAFMISELRRAFEIGFLVFIPFLIIDMVTASILMSMGMMMLPPVMISLPFKIIFFVLVDGWYMIAQSLVNSYR